MMLRTVARNFAPAILRRATHESSAHARAYTLAVPRFEKWSHQSNAAVASADLFGSYAQFSTSTGSTTDNNDAQESANSSQESAEETPEANDAGASEDAATGAAEGEEEAAEPAEPTPEETIARLEAELKEKHEHMMMAYANEQNALRIAKADIAKAREFAVQSFAKSLLDVADNLHRAMDAVPAEAVEAEGNALLKQLIEGVKLTEDGLLKVFKQNGIVKYGDVGDKFDANIHEAMYMYKDPTAEPGTLGQVVSVGYMLKDRCLRPAKAGIVQAEDA